MKILIFAGLILMATSNMLAQESDENMERDTIRMTLKGDIFESQYRIKEWRLYFDEPLDGGGLVDLRTNKGFSGTILISYANGNLCREWNYTDGISLGWQTDYYANGKIHVKRLVDIPMYPPRESYREYYEYNENGNLLHSFVVIETDGKRQYKHVLYHPNGQKKSEGHSVCIMPPPESNEELFGFLSRTGHWVTYHANGQKASEGNWGFTEKKNQWGFMKTLNIRTGKWNYYDETGKVEAHGRESLFKE
jgi:antitoxin component YwqK of YwqJK toxin-antitoxin module